MGCKINVIVFKDWTRLAWINTFILKSMSGSILSMPSNNSCYSVYILSYYYKKSLPHKTGSILTSFIFIWKKYNLLNKTRKQLSAILKARFAVICTLAFSRWTTVTDMEARIVTAINIHNCACPRSKGRGSVCSTWLAEDESGFDCPTHTGSEALGNAMLESLIQEERHYWVILQCPWLVWSEIFQIYPAAAINPPLWP